MSHRSHFPTSLLVAAFALGTSHADDIAASSADTAKAESKLSVEGLPESWDGVWRGEIEVIVGGKRQHQATMELRVQKIGTGSAKTWTIRYTGQPPRDYELRPASTGGGRFVLDEKDGTLLEEQLVGGTLHSVFSVGDVLLTSRFENRGKEIAVEIVTFAFEPARLRDTLNAPAKAASFPFRSIQRGILRRQKE